jgi:hypothetical protein
LVLPAEGRRFYERLAPYGFLVLILLVFVFDGALAFLGDGVAWLVRQVI